MANWEGLFFKKNHLYKSQRAFIFRHQKKKSFSLEQVPSRIIVCILTLFWGRGRNWLVNSQEYASRRTLKGKRDPKKQGNFVGQYYWVLNNYRGLAFCVAVCFVLRCCSSCSRAACSDGTQRRREESASAWAAGVLRTREERARERLEFCRRGRSELVMEREGTGINNILAQGGGALWRTSVLAKHFATQEEARAASSTITSSGSLRRSACLEYASPESNSGQISVFFFFSLFSPPLGGSSDFYFYFYFFCVEFFS